jgi:hypothetical protein
LINLEGGIAAFLFCRIGWFVLAFFVESGYNKFMYAERGRIYGRNHQLQQPSHQSPAQKTQQMGNL